MKPFGLFEMLVAALMSPLVVAAPCDPQPLGSGPPTVPDTVAAFHANPLYTVAASAAITPPGYSWFTYINIPFGIGGLWSAVHMPWANYLGYRFLTSYSTSDCANYCKSNTQCRSFGIHYQRAPALEPSWDNSSTCYDPPSTIQIMCTMWNRTITSSDVEVNFGWPRGGFAVAIVGSRGYNQVGSS